MFSFGLCIAFLQSFGLHSGHGLIPVTSHSGSFCILAPPGLQLELVMFWPSTELLQTGK